MDPSDAFVEFQKTLGGPPSQDAVFVYLSIVTGTLLVLSLLFAGYALLLRSRNRMKARRRTRLEMEWQPLVLEDLAEERSGALLAAVEPRDHVFLLEFLMGYARRLKGREQEVVREIARPVLPSLIPVLASDDPYRRAQAVQIVGSLGLPEYERQVTVALDDESDLVAMVAVRALARQGSSEHLRDVIGKLDRFDNWSSTYLVSLLVSFGSQVAAQLRDLLVDATHSTRVRSATAGALLELHDLRTVPVAVELLATEKDVDLLVALLRVVREMGRPDDLAPVRALATSPSHAVRGEVFHALGALGGEDDFELLAEGLADPSPWAALHAARALKQLAHVDVLTQLRHSTHPRALLAAQVLEESA